MGFTMSISNRKTPITCAADTWILWKGRGPLRMPEACDRRTHRTHFRSDTMKVYQYTLEV